MRPLKYPNLGGTTLIKMPTALHRELQDLMEALDALGEDAADTLTSITDSIKERNG